MIENGYKYLQTTYCIGQHYLILSVKSTVWFLLNINKIHKIIKGALNLKLCVSCIEMAYFSVVWLSFFLQTNRKLVIIEYHNKLRNFGFGSRLNYLTSTYNHVCLTWLLYCVHCILYHTLNNHMKPIISRCRNKSRY